MKPATTRSRVLLSLVLWAAACGESRVPVEDGRDVTFLHAGKADTGNLTEGSDGARGVLALVNAAGRDLLIDDVGLSARVADNIMNVKIGDDGLIGTADDVYFSSLKQLDDVPYVGPAVFSALYTYAESHGFVTSSGSGPADGGTAWSDAGSWGGYPDAATSWPDAWSWGWPGADAGTEDAGSWGGWPDAGWGGPADAGWGGWPDAGWGGPADAGWGGWPDAGWGGPADAGSWADAGPG
jgi:hypothetical protein